MLFFNSEVLFNNEAKCIGKIAMPKQAHDSRQVIWLDIAFHLHV